MNYIRQQPKPLLLTLGIVLVIFVGVLDVITGPEISFSIFFLLPIYLVTLFVGIWAGVLITLLSAVTLLIADMLSGRIYSHPLVAYWNIAVWLSFFLITAITAHFLVRLRRKLEQEARLARIDPLTQVGNRRHFYTLAEMEIGRSLRYKHPFTVIYIDLDDFKLVNDRFGHHIGDQLLYTLASTIQHNLRREDIVVRLGGDEFAVLLPETGSAAAQEAIFRLQSQLLEAMRENGWPVTFSIGVATFISPPDSVDEMLQRADQLMYAAKSSGKGMIKHEVFGSEGHASHAETNA